MALTDDEKRAKRAAYMREYSKRGAHGPCSVEGCERGRYGKNDLCAMHYKRQGRQTPLSTAELLERWWANVDKSGPVPECAPHLGPCWLWTATPKNAYGLFLLNDKTVRAHHAGYVLLVGPVPEGLELDHLCRVTRCVNPAHQEPVTHAVNTLRGESPQAANARKTHCPQGHPYDEANTYVNTYGRRVCRICKAAWRADRFQRLGK